jgi:peroxiredoxin
VRDNISQYSNLCAKVFAISVDSIYTLARYKQDQRLNFSLLSDFNKEVSKAYDSIYEKFGFDMQGVSKRSAFLIDKEGVVQYAEILENASNQPDFTAINKKLNEIMA